MAITFLPDGSVHRSFGDDPQTREAVEAGAQLLDSDEFITAYSHALARIHHRPEPEMKEIIGRSIEQTKEKKEAQVQWYWSEFFSRLRREPVQASEPQLAEKHPTYEIAIKACCEYYFYSLTTGESPAARKYLHTPFFQSSAPPKEPPPQASPQARGIADAIVFLAPRLLNTLSPAERLDTDRLVSELSWFDIHWRCTVVGETPTQLDLEVEWEVHEPSKTVLGVGDPVLVASPNVRRAIGSLAEAWVDPRARCVLVSAASGSGKEPLIQFFADAVMVDERRVSIAAPEVAKEGALVTRLDRDPDLPLERVPPGKAGRRERPGEPPKRALIFLDEIHQESSRPVRERLLRLLETNELPLADGSNVLDCSDVAYVLAASLPPHQLRTSVEPPDLWTRVEYVVEMRHPLDIDGGREERRDVLDAYFKHFWDDNRRRWEKCGEPLPVVERVNRVFGPSDEDELCPVLAEEFCDAFSDRRYRTLSIRELRTLVKRLFGRSVTFARIQDDVEEPDRVRRALRAESAAWIDELEMEIVSVADDRRAA